MMEVASDGPHGEDSMDKKQKWMYTALGSIILSIASLLLPVISYTSARTGVTTRYNISGLLNTEAVNSNIFNEYTGDFLRGMTESQTSFWIVLLSIVGVAAIVLAFIGIRSLNKQYESSSPFRLAICGLIGTAIPSIVLLMLYIFSKNQYAGTMHLGAYIIVTPIAMVIACLTVTSKYRLNQEEAKAQQEAKAYIRPAGDLPPVHIQRGFQGYGQ